MTNCSMIQGAATTYYTGEREDSSIHFGLRLATDSQKFPGHYNAININILVSDQLCPNA